MQRHAVLVARHRRIVLMGGANLAEQWQRAGATSEPTRRDQHRDVLRQGLHDRLALDLSHAAGRHEGRGRLQVWRTQRAGDLRIDDVVLPLDRDVAPADARRRYLELRELLALAALDAAPAVRRQARLDRRATLLAPTVRLTQACIAQRLTWIQGQLGAEVEWPPGRESVDKIVGDIEGRTRFRTWQEHYVAACAYAIPLLDDSITGGRRDGMARAAVARLQVAAACSDGAYVATRRDWLVGEDPDLNGLRTHPAFKRFEAMYFPSARPAPLRPINVQRLESARHIQALLSRTGERWQAVWHHRGATLDRHPDIGMVLQWWEDEYEAWSCVRAVAVHYRHWETRLELVRRMEAWAARYGMEPLVVPSPRYEDQPLPPLAAGSCDTTIAAGDARLDALARALPETPPRTGAHAMLHDIKGWQARLQEIGLIGDEPARYFLAELCDCHAGLWQLLQTWIGEGAAGEEAFVAQVDKARRLWCTAYNWWRPRDVVRALATPGRHNGSVPPMQVLRWQATEWWRERATAGRN